MGEKRPKTPIQAGPRPLRLPVPITGDVGFGDAIQRVTSAVGIKHCSGCARRARTLNRWLVLSGRK